MFKNILNLQSNMNLKMKRDDCINQCIASMKSDLSSLGLQIDDLIPSIKHDIEANFESLNSQLEAMKEEILQAIQTQNNQTISEKD
jgi:DNA anti-recombination protein RmuC